MTWLRSSYGSGDDEPSAPTTFSIPNVKFAWIEMGVRRGKLKVSPNQWGAGRVHGMYYDSINKTWMISCTRKPENSMHGMRQPRDEPVTCRRCLKLGLV